MRKEITMEQTTYTIGQVATSLGCNEKTARMLLNVAGATPRFSEYTTNMEESVTKQTITDLATLRAGGRIERKLTKLLTTWSSEN